MKKSLYLAAIMAFSTLTGNAQQWVQKMQDPNANLYEIRQEFESYWSTRDKNEKGKGYKAFRRWEHFVAPRVYPSGNLSQLALTAKNFEAWKKVNMPAPITGKQKGGSAQIASATFTAVGPLGPISGSAGGQFLKSGRLNFITINPTNSNDLWVGAPAGGLWHSTNGGTSWTTNTDNLPVTGCSDLAIDPTNTLVMYMATGDGDGGDNRSIGVLKSTNAGQTWTTTGLTANVSSYFLIRRLIINPVNPQILLAATNQGIYRTTNGGTTWTVVNSANTFDLEFKPGNPNIVYAGGYAFRLSTNGGQTFSTISAGISNSTARMAVAVTPADSQYVYVLAGSSSSSGFLGMYRSTNAGTTFSVMSTTPNLLGWSSTGGDTGGQAWYDLCCAASPLNKDEVVTGGVNVWRSLNGGSTWTIYGHWTGTGASFTHADHHDLEYNSTGTLYDVNDGTVYRRTSTAWQEISGTMNISQIYRLGLSSLTANKWITGHQDNGTSVWNGTTYNAEIGGDGMDCFISRTSDQVMFGETQYGGLRRSTNGGTSWSSAKSGLPTTDGPWLTVWKQDPVHDDTLYCGYDGLWRSANQGQSWTQLTNLPNTTADITEFAIAPSNNQVIYVVKSSGIYKTVNAGTTWTTVTGNVPVGSASPQYICIDPTDANNAWVVLSGYSSGNKVYMTTNGGTTWTNWSSNLPNLPGNCIVYQPGSNDRVYVGMDVGIYYRDNNSGSWTLYNAGLPNAPVNELEISPANPTILHAATYGRGVWIASLASLAPAPPVTSFSISALSKCTNAAITFSDLSSNAPSSWSWSITPANGYTASSLSAQNPIVSFSSTGTYTVKLQADNTLGFGNVATQTIQVFQSPTVNLVASTQSSICSGSPISFTASGATTYSWSHSGGSGQAASYFPLVSTVYTVTGYSNTCPGVKTVSVNVQQGPSFSVTGTPSLCAGETATLTASSAPNYTWSTGSQQAQEFVSPAMSLTYSVTSQAPNGCKTTKTHFILVSPAPVFTVTANDSVLCAGDAANLYAAGANSFTWEPGTILGYTTTQVFTAPLTFTITGLDHKGCSNTTYFSIHVEECTGLRLNGDPNSHAVRVFPNPAEGLFYVSSAENGPPMTLSVRDISGKVLLEEVCSPGSGGLQVLDLSDFADGLYLLQISGEGRITESFRLIKSR
jgi:hypothetical protein